MARIGSLFIAGTDEFDGLYKCGISYTLSQKAPVSYIYNTQDENWHVEFAAGSNDVVARTKHSISYNNTQSGGFAAIQEALDVFAVKGIVSASLVDPASSSACVYSDNGKSVLSVYGLCDFPMAVSLKVTQTDASGKVIYPAPPPEPVWNESFRYYRLSQCSNDLFDAYRNLFLALEALLNSICKHKSSEKEGAWLHRALTEVNARASLSQLTPTGKEDPVSYIIRSQYKDVRCKLQHAKFPKAQLPHAQPTPQDVKQAYSELVLIWRHIAGAYFSVPTSGGVITYVGFSKMMANVFHGNAIVYYTMDNTAPDKDSTEVSPSGDPSWEFGLSRYTGQVKPGVVRIIGKEAVADNLEHYSKPIHKVCFTDSTTLFGIAHIESGLMVSGVDEWESIHDIRLINSTQPRIEFKT
ncbi:MULTISPECIES: hypothetical protein [Rheinheimera]|uniref:hypothetical protein n=1 Tax=Rheinheimera TaxID=67575 RepID=UPI000EC8E235|nr:hypothetical protein [Rheinheimera sp.]HCU64803.1 hypothetical protein [Rheinheimera sp.]